MIPPPDDPSLEPADTSRSIDPWPTLDATAAPRLPPPPGEAGDRDPLDAWIGLRLGPYRIEAPAGRGGFGWVFRAVDPTGDPPRTVALKVLRPELASTPETLRRFARELKTTARLEPHPNLVGFLDAGEDRGVGYLAMEYVAGASLSERIARDGPLAPDRAVSLAIQAARGLRHAHRAGVVHRDVKPSNLLVDASGTLRVLDWGLARVVRSVERRGAAADPDATEALSSLTATGTLLGTVAYMAPEQALGARDVDRRCDVYSLGCTVFAALTGRPPFEGPSTLEQLIAHREQPPPSLAARLGRRDAITLRLDRLVRRMMAKDPNRRPGSMGEVIGRLEAIGRPTRRPIPRGGGLAAALLLGIGIGIGVALRPSKPIAVPPSVAPAASAARAAAPESPGDPERAAAAWIIAQGGACDLMTTREHPLESLGRGHPLPSEPFHVIRATLERFRPDGYGNPSLTDADLARLADLPRLRMLHLGGASGISGAGFDRLGRLPELEELYLVGTGVRDESLDALARFPNLSVLWLRSTPITDAGIDRLGRLPRLRFLNLSRTRITGAGLARLATVPELTVLYLDDLPQLTASDLRALGDSPRLQSVGLRGSSLLPEELDGLRHHLPFQVMTLDTDEPTYTVN